MEDEKDYNIMLSEAKNSPKFERCLLDAFNGLIAKQLAEMSNTDRLLQVMSNAPMNPRDLEELKTYFTRAKNENPELSLLEIPADHEIEKIALNYWINYKMNDLDPDIK